VLYQLNLSPFWIVDPTVNDDLEWEFKEAVNRAKQHRSAPLEAIFKAWGMGFGGIGRRPQFRGRKQKLERR